MLSSFTEANGSTLISIYCLQTVYCLFIVFINLSTTTPSVDSHMNVCV